MDGDGHTDRGHSGGTGRSPAPARRGHPRRVPASRPAPRLAAAHRTAARGAPRGDQDVGTPCPHGPGGRGPHLPRGGPRHLPAGGAAAAGREHRKRGRRRPGCGRERPVCRPGRRPAGSRPGGLRAGGRHDDPPAAGTARHAAGRGVGHGRRFRGDSPVPDRGRACGQLRRVRDLGPRAAPQHHGRQPQPAAHQAVRRHRGGEARPLLGRPEAPQRVPRAAACLPGRPCRTGGRAAGQGRRPRRRGDARPPREGRAAICSTRPPELCWPRGRPPGTPDGLRPLRLRPGGLGRAGPATLRTSAGRARPGTSGTGSRWPCAVASNSSNLDHLVTAPRPLAAPRGTPPHPGPGTTRPALPASIQISPQRPQRAGIPGDHPDRVPVEPALPDLGPDHPGPGVERQLHRPVRVGGEARGHAEQRRAGRGRPPW